MSEVRHEPRAEGREKARSTEVEFRFESQPPKPPSDKRMNNNLIALLIVLLLAGCAGPQLPPDSPASPTSSQAGESAPYVASSSLDDETTRAITARLKETGASQGKIDDHPGHTAQPSTTPSQKSESKAVVYTCPMHPEIQQNQPGDCPICGMTLIEK